MAWETRILVKENWQDLQNAYTNVTFTFQARRTDYSVYAYNGYGTAYWQIAAGGSSSGNVYFNINWKYGQNVWFNIASWTTSIKHNSDGTYSSYAEAYVYTGVSPSSLSARVDYRLTTIPRESSISSVNGDQIGGGITVNISRQSSSFTHHVWYRLNSSGSWVSLGTGYGTSCSFTLPMSLCNSVTQSTSATLNISIRAMSNGKYVGGEVYYNKTVYVPSNVVPSFSSISVSEAVSAVAALGIYVQNKSKLNLSINGAGGSYGSWITSYTITAAGQTIRSASGTTGIISSSGTVTINATITDSRGRSASKSTSITVKPYSTPRLSGYSIARQSTPTNVLVVASGSVSSLKNGTTEKNKITYTIKYKLTTSTSYTSTVVVNSGLSFSNNNKTLTGINSTKSYDFQLVVRDIFSEVSYPFKLGTDTVLVDYNKNGIGIGKYWERGALDVKGTSYMEHLSIDNSLTVGGITRHNGSFVRRFTGTSGQTGYIKIATFTITGEYVNSPIKLDVSQRGQSQTSSLYIGFANSSSNDPDLNSFYFLGNNNLQAYMTKTQTSNWDLYIAKTESWDSVAVLDYRYDFDYMTNIKITWQGSQSSTIPGSYRQASNMLVRNSGIMSSFGDYVVERGSSGIWEYRKWASGIRECWGTWTGTINLGQNNYSGFHYTNSQQISFPSGLFTRDDVRAWVDMGPTNFIGICRAFARTKDWVRFICAGHMNTSQSGVSVFLYCQQWT